jgi:phage-related protein
MFSERGGATVLLHGFINKTQKSSPRDIETAWKRMQGMEA